jgi:hypothetical protein
VPGVVTHTIGPCDLNWHSERLALVVASPGQDLIRVWPWPVEAPWFEDDLMPRPLSSLDPKRGGCNGQSRFSWGARTGQAATKADPACMC